MAAHASVASEGTCQNDDRSALKRARCLDAPEAISTTQGEAEGYEFWNEHDTLLRQAWHEWEREQHWPSNISLVDSVMHEAVYAAWKDPNEYTENNIKRLWKQVAPGVYVGQLLSQEGVKALRSILDAVHESSDIPRRRPNGMNRHGIIVGDDTPGSVTVDRLSQLIHQDLVPNYIRPMARTLFPMHIGRGDDEQAYAFTIRYSAQEDVQLKEHSDASVVTLNVNLNLPHESNFEGSSVYFVNHDGSKTHAKFEQPGMAILHLGQTRHAAEPIATGERQNMVIWLFGQGGYVRFIPYDPREERAQMLLTPAARWKRR